MLRRVFFVFAASAIAACGAGAAGSEPAQFPEAAAAKPAVKAPVFVAPPPAVFVDEYKLGATMAYKPANVGNGDAREIAAKAMYSPELCSSMATNRRDGDRVVAGTLPKDMPGALADYRFTGAYVGAAYVTKPDAHGSVAVICGMWRAKEDATMRAAFFESIRAAVPSCCTTGFSEKSFEEVLEAP